MFRSLQAASLFHADKYIKMVAVYLFGMYIFLAVH